MALLCSGGAKDKRATLLGVGEAWSCIAAADDWLNTNEFR